MLAALLVSVLAAPIPHLEGPFAPIQHPRIQSEAAAQCSLQVRYNSNAPMAVELTHVGSGCDSTELAAVNAAVTSAKVGGEPAQTPVYQCSITVLWDIQAAATPQLLYAGTGCEGTRHLAISTAARGVSCIHDRGC